MLAGLDEPVVRYLAHAIAEGTPLVPGVTLRMTGRIRVRWWLPFTADQECDGRSFTWRARVGWGPLTLLVVTDRFEHGAGAMGGRLFGRVRVFHAGDPDTGRSAAGRAALEAVLAPVALLPGPGVAWRADGDDAIVVALEIPPERPEVRIEIDGRGAVRSVRALRWGNAGQDAFGYIPFGGHVRAERTFGGLTVPSRLSVGWWFGTPRYEPFFEAEITGLAQVGAG
jgi:hypothetical protein